MSDPVNVFSQVGDLYAECLRDYGPLQGFAIVHEQSADEAPGEVEGDHIRIFFIGDQPDVLFGNGETYHRATFEFEVVTRSGESGTLSRDGLNAIALIVAAIAQDRSMGGMLSDSQEIDLGSTEANGLDANGVSIQIRAEFSTSRDDWFTLVPQS